MDTGGLCKLTVAWGNWVKQYEQTKEKKKHAEISTKIKPKNLIFLAISKAKNAGLFNIMPWFPSGIWHNDQKMSTSHDFGC